MVHYQALIVKVAAIVGAAQIVGAAVAESDVERRAHGGLWGPLVGAVKGVGNAFVGTANTVGAIFGRIIPPRNPRITTTKVIEGATVLAIGPAFLGLLFASIYLDAKRKRELRFDIEY